LLKMNDGTEAWHDVDDLQQVLTTGYDLAEGEEVVSALHGKRGRTKTRTTTEVLILHDDGTEEWHEVENVGRAKSSINILDLDRPGSGDTDLVDQEEEDAKQAARDALTAALMGDAEEDAKKAARDALTAALMGDADEQAKSNARDALTEALLGDGDDHEKAKANARDAVTAALLGGDEGAKAEPCPVMAAAKKSARKSLMSMIEEPEPKPAPTPPSVLPFNAYYAANFRGGASVSTAMDSIHQRFGKPKEPKDEPPPEAQKKDEASASPARTKGISASPPDVARSVSPARSQALSAADFAELEQKIRQRNERFRAENDSLKRENARLKAKLNSRQAGPDAS